MYITQQNSTKKLNCEVVLLQAEEKGVIIVNWLLLSVKILSLPANFLNELQNYRGVGIEQWPIHKTSKFKCKTLFVMKINH